MEEYDDITRGPDTDGHLNISYNELKELPREVYTLHKRSIRSLNLSYNNLLYLSNYIGNLVLLKELNLSHNQMERLDPAIGCCIRLRVLDVSNNLLVHIPAEIVKCQALDTLLCNSNRITSLPNELGQLELLEQLDVRNNELTDIPKNLCLIPSLHKIHCDGNKNLASIPADMRSDSSMVLWCLRLHQTYEKKIEQKRNIYDKIETMAKESEASRMEAKEKLAALSAEVKALKDDHPDQYLKIKSQVVNQVHVLEKNIRKSIVKVNETVKRRRSTMRAARKVTPVVSEANPDT